MNHIGYATTLVAAIAAAVVFSSCRTLENSQHEKKNWTIQRVSGEWITGCMLDSLSGSVLSFHHDTLTKTIDLDSLAIVWPPDRSKRILGLFVGAAAGFVAGYLVAPEPKIRSHTYDLGLFDIRSEESIDHRFAYAGIGGSILGFLGYTFGSTGGEKAYDLQERDLRSKTEIVSLLLRGKRP